MGNTLRGIHANFASEIEKVKASLEASGVDPAAGGSRGGTTDVHSRTDTFNRAARLTSSAFFAGFFVTFLFLFFCVFIKASHHHQSARTV